MLLEDKQFQSLIDPASAMMTVCSRGHIEGLKILLDKEKNYFRDSNCFFMAACRKRRLEVMKILLRSDKIKVSGQGHLKTAVQKKHVETVKLLLKSKRLNFCCEIDEAVELACKHGHAKVLRLLLKKKIQDNLSMGFMSRLFFGDCLVNNRALKFAYDGGKLKIVES